MKITLLSISLFLFAITFGFSQNNTKNYIDENYIEVTGSAEMEVTPDEIYLKVILREKDNKRRDPITIQQMENKMFAKLKEIGVNVEQNVYVVDVSSNFKHYWIKKANIFSQKEFQILCKDATTVGKVFKGLEEINISNINIARIDHSKKEQFRQEIKVNAIKAAKAKANYLAEAIGQKIGKAIHIQEIDFIDYARFPGVQSSSNIMIQEASYGEAQIQFEKLKFTSKIAVKFKLE